MVRGLPGADDILLFSDTNFFTELYHELGEFRQYFFSSSEEGAKVHSQWMGDLGLIPPTTGRHANPYTSFLHPTLTSFRLHIRHFIRPSYLPYAVQSLLHGADLSHGVEGTNLALT